jgi:hypothetical protein
MTSSIRERPHRRWLEAVTTLAVAGAVAAVVVACAVPPVNTSLLLPTPGLPLVARKVQTPLLIVLDPELVPESYAISSLGKNVEIREIREFVRRDIKLAMQRFFRHVEVVDADEIGAPFSHVAHVRIDRFDAQGSFPGTPGVGVSAPVAGRMTWAFAILPVGARDYLFSWSATTLGDVPLVRIGQMPLIVESTYRAAIEQMIEGFVESGAYERLLSLEESQVPSTMPVAPAPTDGGEPEATASTGSDPDGGPVPQP